MSRDVVTEIPFHSLSEVSLQLHTQLFRWRYDQFGLEKLLQEIVVITVVGIKVLSAYDFDETAEAFPRAISFDRIDGIVET